METREKKNELLQKASEQMRELEISSASSRTKMMSPTGSNVSEVSNCEKKLPMNKIQVGTTPSPQISKATSKIGSLENKSYKPSGGNVKITSKKLQWKGESKIGSLGNLGHKAGGGGVKIQTSAKPTTVKLAQSRIGSLQNVKYAPGGGDKKIFDDKEYLKRARSSDPSKGDASRRSSSLARGD